MNNAQSIIKTEEEVKEILDFGFFVEIESEIGEKYFEEQYFNINIKTISDEEYILNFRVEENGVIEIETSEDNWNTFSGNEKEALIWRVLFFQEK